MNRNFHSKDIYLKRVLTPKLSNEDIIGFSGQKYPKNLRNEIVEQIKTLPILKQLPEITESIKHNLITIIEAQTGSGKTTQIGKIALLVNKENKKGFNKVHMTQPRVLAALSNASRISDELLSQINNPLFSLGDIVGYRTGNYDKTSNHTKLLLTTDAQEVLRQLVNKVLPDYLILDEVHTYTVDIEILLAMMKQYIAENPDIKTKFIIMTATLDKQLIVNYLQGIVNDKIPYFDVPGKMFNIDEQILPSNEFINSIVENTDINGEGKVLVFVDGKKKIYDTIKSLERIFGKNLKEAKKAKMELELNNFINSSIDLLKDFLKDDFENIVNVEEIKKFEQNIVKEIENKINNISYIINKESIFSQLYELFFANIKQKNNQKLDELLADIYEKGINTLNNILLDLEYVDNIVEDLLQSLKRKANRKKDYKNTILEEIENETLKDYVNNINFSVFDGFLFMIRDFLRRTIDKGVNKKLINDKLEKAYEHLHPSKIYEFYKKEVESIFFSYEEELRKNLKKYLETQNVFEKIDEHLLEKDLDDDIKEKIKKYFKEIENLDNTKGKILKKLGQEIFAIDLYEEFVEEFNKNIEKIEKYLETKVNIIPLHSDLSQQEQEKAFDKNTKIIVATDIAEMSLTIPNVNTVIDSGKVKIAYINNDGIPTLEVINISKAQSKQRKGRTGRTGPGKYIWTNNTNPDNLDDFPITDIEKGHFFRHYLILLAGGKKMEEMDFLHKVSEKHIEIVKKHLQSLGAINQEGEITKIGEKIVLIPTEPYVGRILYEAEKRGCLKQAIVFGAILETNSFVSIKNKTWKKFKFKNSSSISDLFYFYNWYKLLTSKKIDENTKTQLIGLGIRKDILDDFNNNEYQLFEVIDLNTLGIKEKYFLEIIQNIERLEKYYNENNIEISSSEKEKDLLISILAGLSDNIYQYSGRKGIVENENKGVFSISDTGVVKTNYNQKYLYIGLPMIIKNENGRTEKVLQKVSKIDAEYIAEFFVYYNTEGKSLTLTSKTIKKERKKVLQHIKPIEGISLDKVIFESGKDSFSHMFKYVYLPELLINENKYFVNWIKKLEENETIIDINKLKELIGENSDILYEEFKNSKESPRKIEEKFKNNKEFFEYFINLEEVKTLQ